MFSSMPLLPLRKRKFLIGDIEPQIYGNKLPSIGQVLKALLHHREIVSNTPVRESARLVLDRVKVFWNKARLPIQYEARCVDKIVKLHTHYRNLQKSKGLSSNSAREKAFVARFDNLFDIGHGKMIGDLPNDDPRKDFYLNQKRDGRVGHIDNIEKYFVVLEERRNRKIEILDDRLSRNEVEVNKLDTVAD